MCRYEFFSSKYSSHQARRRANEIARSLADVHAVRRDRVCCGDRIVSAPSGQRKTNQHARPTYQPLDQSNSQLTHFNFVMISLETYHCYYCCCCCCTKEHRARRGVKLSHMPVYYLRYCRKMPMCSFALFLFMFLSLYRRRRSGGALIADDRLKS